MTESLEKRLEKLERANHRMKLAGAVALIVLAGGGVTAMLHQAAQIRTLQDGEFKNIKAMHINTQGISVTIPILDKLGMGHRVDIGPGYLAMSGTDPRQDVAFTTFGVPTEDSPQLGTMLVGRWETDEYLFVQPDGMSIHRSGTDTKLGRVATKNSVTGAVTDHPATLTFFKDGNVIYQVPPVR